MLTRVYSSTKTRRDVRVRRPLAVALLGSTLLLAHPLAGSSHRATPEEALKSYFVAVYARDYQEAYQWISREDRTLKSQQEYLREHGTFSGAALEVTRTLAGLIRFHDLETVHEGGLATVTFTVILPNANDPTIHELFLEFDEERLTALTPAERRARVDKLREMVRAGRLPVIVGEKEQWELIREDGSWRVFLNWTGAVTVRFQGVTKAGLPWEFAPVQPVVRAKPGETLQALYRVKNVSDRQITGKAHHVLDPREEMGHLEIVACFCFLQQTLDPGEEQVLPVIFRVNYEVPTSIREMRVRYEFFPIDQFPAGKRQ
ncbi:MAG: cytochrome c oxidase assembly protein [Acidobacteriota bacterium]